MSETLCRRIFVLLLPLTLLLLTCRWHVSCMPQLEIVTFNYHLTISQCRKFVCQFCANTAGSQRHRPLSGQCPIIGVLPFYLFTLSLPYFTSFWSINQPYLPHVVGDCCCCCCGCYCRICCRGSHFSLATLQFQRIYLLCAQNWLKYFQLIWVLQSVVGILWNRQLPSTSVAAAAAGQRALRATRKLSATMYHYHCWLTDNRHLLQCLLVC